MEKFTKYAHALKESLLTTQVADHKDHKGSLIPLNQGVEQVVDFVLAVRSKGKKIMVLGNGGSAAIAQHFHNDLLGAVGVKSMIFTDSSMLTALANDYGYQSVYEKPVKLWAEKGDLVVAISSSGESENILNAVDAALESGATVVTLSGFKPHNSLFRRGTVNFYVRSDEYGLVETAHSVITHYLTDRAMALTQAPAWKDKPAEIISLSAEV